MDTPAAPALSQPRALRRAGRLLGASLVIAAAVSGAATEAGLLPLLPFAALFTAAGLLAGAAIAAALDAAFAGRALSAETNRGNAAAGLLSAAHAVAAGILVSRCVYGQDLGTLAVSLAFCALGGATLIAFQMLHRKLTHYADAQEVCGENVAAALSSGGVAVALAIIVGHAAEGTFVGWGDSLRAYGLALLLSAGLYPVRQILVKGIILGFPITVRGRRLDSAIAQDRDVVIGAVEAAGYIAAALLVTGVA